MERIRLASNIQIVRKNDQYFRLEYNKYTKSQSISELDFSESDTIAHRTGSHSRVKYDKVKLDILFALEKHPVLGRAQKTS